MNEQQYRDVLLAKALEQCHADTTSAAAPLLNAQDLRAATEKALHEAPTPRSGTAAQPRQLERLLVRRAEHLLQAANARAPGLQALRKPPRVAQWLWWLPVLALLLGFASEKLGQPHRLNLVALPLLAIVGWNLLLYASGLLRSLWRLRRPRPAPAALAAPTAAPWEPALRWWSRSTLAMQDERLRKVYQHFVQDWTPYRQARQARLLRAWLHLGAAALALGMIAAMWVTGMFVEYRIGWESTWLSAPQMQALANTLSWPAQQLLGMAPWSIEQIERLQAWPAGQQQSGQQWILAYSLLLALVVVVPRLLLAAWHWSAALRQSRALHLPLAEPYFQGLVRDFSSDATHILVLPFSMSLDEARQQRIRHFVQQQFGAAAHLHFGPSLAYGDQASHGGDYFRNTLEAHTPSLQALLFNLSATPEEETHGSVLRQFDAHVSGARSVWLYGHELAQRLGPGEAARQRLTERCHLWQTFVEHHGLHAEFIGTDLPRR